MTQPSRIAALAAYTICKDLAPWVTQGPTLEGSPDHEEAGVVKYGDIQLVILSDGAPIGGQEAVDAFLAAVNERFSTPPPPVIAYTAFNLYELGARGQAIVADPASLGAQIDKAEIEVRFIRMIPGVQG